MLGRGATRGRLAGAGTPFNWPAAIGFDRQPFTNVVTDAWKLTAGAQGLQIGAFAWADPVTGVCSNQQVAGAPLGFVIPVFNWYNWQRVFRQKNAAGIPSLFIRSGVECVLAATGDFTATFPLGAQAGQQVYTDPATGLPYGGAGLGLVATPWTVMQNGCECNARLKISTAVRPVS